MNLMGAPPKYRSHGRSAYQGKVHAASNQGLNCGAGAHQHKFYVEIFRLVVAG